MAKDQNIETNTPAAFVITDDWAVTSQGKQVKISPVPEADGVQNGNVVFAEFVANVTKFAMTEGDATKNAFRVEANGETFDARSEHVAILALVNAVNDSENEIGRVKAKNKTGFSVEIVTPFASVSNEPPVFDEKALKDREKHVAAIREATAKEKKAVEERRKAAFAIGKAVYDAKAWFDKAVNRDASKKAGKAAWGEFLADALPTISKEKAKNYASEHALLAEFPAEYWEFAIAANPDIGSAKLLNTFHADTRKELCARLIGDTFNDMPKEAKSIMVTCKGADAKTLMARAEDMLRDTAGYIQIIDAKRIEIASEDVTKAYHHIAGKLSVSDLQANANYLRNALIDAVNNELNTMSPEEQEVAETVEKLESIADKSGFHNFKIDEAAQHLLNILVSHPARDEIFDQMDKDFTDACAEYDKRMAESDEENSNQE